MQEIDLKLLFSVLLSRVKWIVTGVVIVAFLFASYSYFFVPEQYASTAKLYVRNMGENTQANSSTASNLSAAEYLANTYAKGIKLKPILKAACERMNDRITSAELSRMVSASGVEDSSFLEISVRHTDPEIASQACEAIANTLASDFPILTGDPSSAKVADPASKAVKVAPNVVRNGILGALVGGLFMVALFVLREVLDNTIRDKETLKLQMDVPVLGEIPSFTQSKKGGKRHA